MIRAKKSKNCGTIYVVATPIGNLGDFTPRAQAVLNEVDLIAAEDTRHSQRLLSHFNINTPMIAYHEHNESQKAQSLIDKVLTGKNLALISDAGTPLISDPGYRLIHEARKAGIEVISIPGACAAIAALSISGLPTDKFLFAGFLPAKSVNRKKCIDEFSHAGMTVIFYESTHRILASLKDIQDVIPTRELVLARELTKAYETVSVGTAAELMERMQLEPNEQKGEFVLLLAPEKINEEMEDSQGELENLLTILLEEMQLKKAVNLAAKITKKRKNFLYDLALKLSSR